jgi:hypothetical protein
MIRRQITELLEIKPVVVETWQYEVRCPCCGALQRGELPAGLEAGRYFGLRLEATVTYLHHEQHVGYQRLLQLCAEVFGLSLSPGGAVASPFLVSCSLQHSFSIKVVNSCGVRICLIRISQFTPESEAVCCQLFLWYCGKWGAQDSRCGFTSGRHVCLCGTHTKAGDQYSGEGNRSCQVD